MFPPIPTPLVNDSRYHDVKQTFQKLRSGTGINIAHLNVCSLFRNIDEIRNILTNENISILSLSETRLDSSVSEAEICIPGYRSVRLDRNRNGGGILTYIKEDIPFNVKRDLFIDGLELMCVEICLAKQKPFVIVYWYRPPDSNIAIFDKVEALFQSLEFTSKDVIFYGDLNCDLLKDPLSSNAKRLQCLAEDFNLKQTVDKPTRVTPTSATLIDVIYSSNPEKLTFCDVIPLSMSDHYMVICSLGKMKTPTVNHKFAYCRNTKRLNIEELKADLSQVSWDDVLTNSDPLDAYEAWFLKFKTVLDKHAPLRKKRVRQKEAPWINVDILNKIRERDDMKKKANTSKSEDDWKSYKKLRNAVTDMIRKAKRLYVSENIASNKGNSTAMWTTLRRILPKKVNVSSIQKLTVNGEEITGSKNIASYLNNHFVDLAANRKKDKKFGGNMEQYMAQVKSSFGFKETTQSEVLKCVNNVARNKATGLDEIPTSILKDSIECIVEPITHIINLSLKTYSYVV